MKKGENILTFFFYLIGWVALSSAAFKSAGHVEHALNFPKMQADLWRCYRDTNHIKNSVEIAFVRWTVCREIIG
ncbi:hypothetical protein V8G21_004655 [Salmonella enterica]|nr:hypothetical protein [Salmonella enterica]